MLFIFHWQINVSVLLIHTGPLCTRWWEFYFCIFIPVTHRPNSMSCPSLMGLRDHAQTHHIRLDSSRRVISPSQRPVPDNTHHPQDINILAYVGIRTDNPSRRVAPDPHFRSHGNPVSLWWGKYDDQPMNCYLPVRLWPMLLDNNGQRMGFL